MNGSWFLWSLQEWAFFAGIPFDVDAQASAGTGVLPVLNMPSRIIGAAADGATVALYTS